MPMGSLSLSAYSNAHVARPLALARQLMADSLIVRATERYSYGFVDIRARYASETEMTLRTCFNTIFKTEAEQRGYDMALFKQTNPRGHHYAYGIIASLPD